MPRKKTINLAVPEPLLQEFNEVCAHYGHAKQKGLVLSAAILAFLESDPAEQGKALERIMIADVRSGVDMLVQRARAEQARRIDARDKADAPDAPDAGGDGPGEDHPAESALPRAAKKAGSSKKPLKHLPPDREPQ